MSHTERWDVTPPSSITEAYRRAGLWRNATIVDDARRIVRETPDKVLWTDSHGTLTGSEALWRAEKLGAVFLDWGLVPGDVVSFQLPNWKEAIVIDLAAALCGLVINPIVPIYRGAELASILADAGSKVLFVPDHFRGVSYVDMIDQLRSRVPDLQHLVVVRGTAREGTSDFEELLAMAPKRRDFPKVEPQWPKLLMYTSGTTGRAKGVLHSHETNAAALQACARYWNIGKGERILMPSPITHITGFSYGMEWPLIDGTETIFMEKWDPDAAVKLIDDKGIVATIGATPFLVELLAAAERAGSRLPSLRVFGCGGAAVPPALIRMANTQLENSCAFRIYGSTEAPVVTLGYLGAENADAAADTDGKIVGYEVKLVDENRRPVPDGTDGEIWVKGPTLFLGYSHADDKILDRNPEGYFEMGDIGRIVLDGGILITGRKKDIIIRGGENLSAKEIEDHLHHHDAIQEAAVVSMPHGRLGETVAAYVIARGEARPSVAEIAEFLDARGLARQKAPEAVVYVDDFPRTTSGKVRKDVLRVMIREAV